MAKITLFGMETYLNAQNDSLFKSATFPASCDKDIFIDNLLIEGGEFGVLYADPDFMKAAIARWFAKNSLKFGKIFEAYNAAYDPTHNYDRTTEMSDTEQRQEDKTHNDSVTSNNSTETSSGVTTQSGNEHKVSAYDESAYSPHDKDEGSVNEQSGTVGSSSGTETQNGSEGLKASLQRGHSERSYGNIGVTTTTQLLREEINFRKDFDPYDMMIDCFIFDFLIPVYD